MTREERNKFIDELAETLSGSSVLYLADTSELTVENTNKLRRSCHKNNVTMKVVKNKLAPPFRKAEFDIMYGLGISKVGEIIDLGVDYEIVKKSGSWFSYGETKLGQGRDAVKSLIKDNPELMDELEEKVRTIINSGK